MAKAKKKEPNIYYEMYKAEFGKALLSEEEFVEITMVDQSDDKAVSKAWYAAYSRCFGGKLSAVDYAKVQKKFVSLTEDAFVGGEGDRGEAMARFAKWLRKNYPGENADIIFRSVDLITAYS